MMPEPPARWRKALLVAVGYACVGLAIAGVFLPVLPTTPFLLLASACFVRSSPASQRWLLEHRLAGPFLRDWHEHRAVSRSVKSTAVVTVLAALGLTLWLSRGSWLIQAATSVLCGIGLIVITRLPVLPSKTGESSAGSRHSVTHRKSA